MVAQYSQEHHAPAEETELVTFPPEGIQVLLSVGRPKDQAGITVQQFPDGPSINFIDLEAAVRKAIRWLGFKSTDVLFFDCVPTKDRPEDSPWWHSEKPWRPEK